MSGSLRIVFVAPFGLRKKTTVWARALPLARELSRLGHSASIIIPPWDCPQDSGSLIIQDGVRLEHVTLDGGLPLISARLLQRVIRESPDIVHIIKPRAYAGITQWFLWQTRRSKVNTSKIVLDIDDWEKPWAAINRYPRYQAMFLQWQEEWGIRHADGITAASRWLVNKARNCTPQTPTLYLPNGVDIHNGSVTRNYALHDPPRILLLSRFVEIDSAWIGEFWRALRHTVRDAVRDAVLLVAGSALHPGGEAPYLKALAETGGSVGGSNVAWLGYVSPDELPKLYDSVDCAIFPSENTALHQAKCSVRLANVLHYGVPTVASSVGEQAGYAAGGSAVLLPPGSSPQEFAGAVVDVLQSEPYRRSLGQTAVERIGEKFAWPLFGQRLNDFYMQVLSSE